MTNDLAIPTVHINGTSQKELSDGLEKALNKIDEAILALRDAWPHGRDYHPRGPDAYGRANDQWKWRLQQLSRVRNELETIIAGVMDAVNAK